MKKRTRIICGIIAIVLALLFVGGILFSAIAYAAAPMEKSETVYVAADAKGAAQSVLSSVYLTNPEKLDVLTDFTTLLDIRVISGADAPAREGNALSFAAEGADVAYQGKADGRLPVSMEISYQMDGKSFTPEQMRGKAGRAAIRVAFTNNHRQQAEVSGKPLSLFTPFTAVAMLTLGEDFQNIAVENAKMISEAGITTITGLVFPGLAANIDAEDTGRLAESFCVTADVTNFEFDGMTAIVLTGIVDVEDIRDLDDLKELTDGIGEMSDAGDTLYKGTRQLYDGVSEFDHGILEYIDGVKQLRDGIPEAISGTGELYSAAWELHDGAKQLQGGLQKLLDGLEESANMQVSIPEKTISDAIIKELEGSGIYDSLMSAAEGIAIKRYLLEHPDETLSDIPPEALDAMRQAAREEAKAQLRSAADGMAGPISDKMGGLVSEAVLSALSPMMKELSGGVSQLRDGAKQLKEGLSEYAGGVDELQKGMLQLYDGANTLALEGQKLVDGAGELLDGVGKLKKGVKELNEEGLKELASNTEDMNIILERKDAMARLGKQYETFSGKPEGAAGSVKFVYETESVYVEKPLETPKEEEDAQAVLAEEQAPGFFARIWSWMKGLFGA